MNWKTKLKAKGLSNFEVKVLLATARIPKGETRTYSQIARAIRKPKSSRAVGNALAKNPFAPQIPCHRVIKSNGDIGNYSANGGRKTKMMLLKKEGALRNG